MKINFKRLGWLLLIFMFLPPLALTFYEFTHPKYIETSFKSDYSWNDIQVGTIMRVPVNIGIPIGRYREVVAFKHNSSDTRILFQGPKGGEVPRTPEFVSGKENIVIYRTFSGEVTFDLSNWSSYEKRGFPKIQQAQPDASANHQGGGG